MPMIRAMESTTIPTISPILTPSVSVAGLFSVVTVDVAETVIEMNISAIVCIEESYKYYNCTMVYT